MAGRGSHRGRGVVEDRGGDGARGIGFAAARERLPALRLRPVGRPVAAAPRARGRDPRRGSPTTTWRASSIETTPSGSWPIFATGSRSSGLELHPDKTRLIEFGRFAAERRERRGLRKPETFEFLGFTHICATDRHGRFKLKRVTSKKKMRAKLKSVKITRASPTAGHRWRVRIRTERDCCYHAGAKPLSRPPPRARSRAPARQR